MTFKTLSKRQNGTVDLSLFSLHLIEGRVIPDWKKFISSGENIIIFLGDYIDKHIRQNSSLQEGQSLYLASLFSNPETVKMLNQNGMLHCSCLASTQEEADTRIISHALYSTNMFGNVIAEKSNNIFTRTNKLFPVRNNPTFNQMQ
jgi:hypothetical protein